MVQTGFPINDTQDGDWVNSSFNNTDNYSYIDNGIPGDSSTYVINSNFNSDFSNAVSIFGMTSSLSTPGAGDQKIRFRAGGQGFFGSTSVTISIATGTNADDIVASIQTGITTDPSVSDGFGDYTLTAGEKSSITDYSSLYFFISGFGEFGENPAVKEVVFEIPDAGGGGGGEGPKLNPEAFLMFL